MSSSDSDHPLIISVRYAEGEQFWKLWSAKNHLGTDLRILSKRQADGTFSAGVQFTDDHGVRSWMHYGLTNDQLDAMVAGLMGKCSDKSFRFKCLDLSRYARFDQFVHAVSESVDWSYMTENLT